MLSESFWYVFGGVVGGFAEVDDGSYVSNRDSDDLESMCCNSLPDCLGDLEADWHTAGDNTYREDGSDLCTHETAMVCCERTVLVVLRFTFF